MNEPRERMQGIPHAVSDLTPEWLSERLGRAIAGFHFTKLDGGMMSDRFKLGSIAYRDSQSDAPLIRHFRMGIAPKQMYLPGTAILLTALPFNTLGEASRVVPDPTARRR